LVSPNETPPRYHRTVPSPDPTPERAIPEAGARPSLEMFRLILGHIGLHSAFSGMRMAAPLLALSLGYGTASIGVLMAMFAAAQIAIALPARRLVNDRGLKFCLTLCGVSAASGIGLAAAWPALPALGLGALCCGGAIGLSLITLQRHVGRAAASDAELRRGLSWVSIAPTASTFIGPLLAGALIDNAGYQAAFMALGLLPLGSLVAARLAREIPMAPAPTQAPSAPWSLLRLPHFRQLMVLNWLMSACWDLHGFMVPVIAHERGISASSIGMLMGAFALAATLSRRAVPAIASRAPDWLVLAIAVTLSGALLALYPFLESLPSMMACSFALGALLGAVQPLVMILIHKVAPEHRQVDAMALRMMMFNGSGIAMPMAYGAAGIALTASGVFHAAGVVVFLGGGLCIRAVLGLLREQKEAERAPPPA
jgi:predicted MFS family arabinose efflux permease